MKLFPLMHSVLFKIYACRFCLRLPDKINLQNNQANHQYFPIITKDCSFKQLPQLYMAFSPVKLPYLTNQAHNWLNIEWLETRASNLIPIPKQSLFKGEYERLYVQCQQLERQECPRKTKYMLTNAVRVINISWGALCTC